MKWLKNNITFSYDDGQDTAVFVDSGEYTYFSGNKTVAILGDALTTCETLKDVEDRVMDLTSESRERVRSLLVKLDDILRKHDLGGVPWN